MAKPRVLIIDDDAVLKDLLALYLKVGGYEVVKAPDGRAGFERLQEEYVDLVILDLMMPIMDGVSFMRALKNLQSPPPVLVLSAAGFGQLERDMRSAGARAVLRKPVNPTDLVAQVRDALAEPD